MAVNGMGMRLTADTLRRYALGRVFRRSAQGAEYQVWEGPAGRFTLWVRPWSGDQASVMHTGPSLAALAATEPAVGFALPAWSPD